MNQLGKTTDTPRRTKTRPISNPTSQQVVWVDGPDLDDELPLITVGVRFHDMKYLQLLERCLLCIAAQNDVRVHVRLALQGFSTQETEQALATALRMMDGSGFRITVHNVPNPDGIDLRARLLNCIVDAHYVDGTSDFLCFIDYDDIWFHNALNTMVKPLLMGEFSMSYADIHCADVFFDAGQFYLRNISDIYGISKKTKRDLLRGNFLPLHSYMFHTGRIDRTTLAYNETLERLEDYDVLLSVGRNHAISSLHRKKLIGLYNFYETADDQLNTTQNIFMPNGERSRDTKWQSAIQTLLQKHTGSRWQEFWGEEWAL